MAMDFKLDTYIARERDIPQVCKILASAFTNDPVLGWVSGHPEIYHSFFRTEIESLYKHHNHIYINKEQTGAAMWLPPGVSTKPTFHWRLLLDSWNLLRTGGPKSLKRGIMIEEMMYADHPKEPHYYLRAIGASSGNQGRGIGSALLEDGLFVCDQRTMPVYLESSNVKNNPLYERYGFRVIDEVTLPDNGPTIWCMKREAKNLALWW